MTGWWMARRPMRWKIRPGQRCRCVVFRDGRELVSTPPDMDALLPSGTTYYDDSGRIDHEPKHSATRRNQRPPTCALCAATDWHARLRFGKEVTKTNKAEARRTACTVCAAPTFGPRWASRIHLVFTADRAGEVQADMNTREYSKTSRPDGSKYDLSRYHVRGCKPWECHRQGGPTIRRFRAAVQHAPPRRGTYTVRDDMGQQVLRGERLDPHRHGLVRGSRTSSSSGEALPATVAIRHGPRSGHLRPHHAAAGSPARPTRRPGRDRSAAADPGASCAAGFDGRAIRGWSPVEPRKPRAATLVPPLNQLPRLRRSGATAGIGKGARRNASAASTSTSFMQTPRPGSLLQPARWPISAGTPPSPASAAGSGGASVSTTWRPCRRWRRRRAGCARPGGAVPGSGSPPVGCPAASRRRAAARHPAAAGTTGTPHSMAVWISRSYLRALAARCDQINSTRLTRRCPRPASRQAAHRAVVRSVDHLRRTPAPAPPLSVPARRQRGCRSPRSAARLGRPAGRATARRLSRAGR